MRTRDTRLARSLADLTDKLSRNPIPPRDAPAPVYNCVVCNDRGFVEFLTLKGEEDARQLDPNQWGALVQYEYPGSRLTRADCNCVRNRAVAARLQALLEGGGVPKRFHQYSFASWRALSDDSREGKERMLAACERYAAFTFTGEGKGGLVLSGVPGLGKTGLASCVVMERARRGQHVLWIDWKELLDKIKAAIRDPKIDVDAIISAAGEIQFLFIDDLGDMRHQGDVTDFVRDTLYSIISRRYNHCRELLLTTNLTYEQFEEQFGERIASRVWQMCAWVDVHGKNLREDLP